MQDQFGVSQALTAMKLGVDIAKAIGNVGHTYEKAELKSKINDLVEAIGDARMQVLDLQEQLIAQHEEIRALRATRDVKARLRMHDGAYFLKDPAEGEHAGPFCPVCYAADGKLISVSELPSGYGHIGKYRCALCKGNFR